MPLTIKELGCLEQLNLLPKNQEDLLRLSPFSHPVDKIIHSFKKAIELGHSKYTTNDMARKVHLLSESVRHYYWTSCIGCFVEFFSACKNKYAGNSFISSGELGIELSQRLLAENLPKVEPLPSNPVTIPVQPPAQEIQKECTEKFIKKDPPSEEVNPTPTIVESTTEESTTIEDCVICQTVNAPSHVHVRMEESLTAVWQDATHIEKKELLELWGGLLKGAKVENWNEINENSSRRRFHLELQDDVVGKHKDYPGNTIVSKSLIVEFYSKEMKKIIAFPNHGIKHRISKFGMSVDIPMKSIAIEIPIKDPSTLTREEITVTIAARLGSKVTWILKCLGKSPLIVTNPGFIETYLKTIVWKT